MAGNPVSQLHEYVTEYVAEKKEQLAQKQQANSLVYQAKKEIEGGGDPPEEVLTEAAEEGIDLQDHLKDEYVSTMKLASKYLAEGRHHRDRVEDDLERVKSLKEDGAVEDAYDMIETETRENFPDNTYINKLNSRLATSESKYEQASEKFQVASGLQELMDKETQEAAEDEAHEYVMMSDPSVRGRPGYGDIAKAVFNTVSDDRISRRGDAKAATANPDEYRQEANEEKNEIRNRVEEVRASVKEAYENTETASEEDNDSGLF